MRMRIAMAIVLLSALPALAQDEAAPLPAQGRSFAERATLFDEKIGAHWERGSDGFLVWSFYDPRSDHWEGWDFGPTDPLAAVLRKRANQPF